MPQRGMRHVRAGLITVVVLLLVTSSHAEAQVFGPPELLQAQADSIPYPHLATDGAGVWIAVWNADNPDADIMFSRSTDDGVTWSAAAPLNTNAAVDSEPDAFARITTDGAGTWVAVWVSWDTLGGILTGDADILKSRSTDNGLTWTAPTPLNQNAIADTSVADADSWPQILTDGTTWLVVWQSADDMGAGNGPFGQDDDIFFARSTDGGATFSLSQAVHSYAAGDSQTDGYPYLAMDGAGTWLVVWESAENVGGTIGDDFDILMSRSTDAGLSWSAPEPVNSTATGDQIADWDAKIVYGGNGTWIAAWQSWLSAGADSDLFFARSSDGGGTWSAATPLNADYLTDDRFDGQVSLASDGMGRWMAIWSRSRPSAGDVWIARSTDDAATWTAPARYDAAIHRPFLERAADTWLVAFGAPGRDVSVARSFPCATDADCANPNECATKTCDALDPNADPSGCVYGAVPGATPCSDDDACTSGDACTSDICIPGGPVVCARCEICTTLDGCIVAPQSGCQQAVQAPYPSPLRRSKLLLRSKENDNADQVKWTFRGGKSQDFGDPMNTTDFTLCVYDAGGSDLLFSAAAPAGDQCAGRDCWVPAGNGFKYRDRELTPDGIVRITLKKPAASAPFDAQSRISLAGGGGNLGLPLPLDVELPIKVQLRTSDAGCWDASFPSVGVRRNEPEIFNGRASPGGAFISPPSAGLMD